MDLDGTLLNDQKQLSQINEDSIRKIIKKGIIVVPITGRPKKGISDFISNLFSESYIITSNGAVITDAKLQKDIEGFYINNETAIKILNSISKVEEKVNFEVFVNGIGYVQKEDYHIITQKFKGTPLESYILNSRIPVNNISRFITDRNNDIAEISIMTESVYTKNKIEKTLAEFNNIKITSSVPTDLEINAAEAGKGAALLRLAKMLGIHWTEVMALGDSGNDIEMLQSAGIGVAMGNAEEGVKQISDYVTLSNEDNGVAYAINRFILQNIDV